MMRRGLGTSANKRRRARWGAASRSGMEMKARGAAARMFGGRGVTRQGRLGREDDDEWHGDDGEDRRGAMAG